MLSFGLPTTAVCPVGSVVRQWQTVLVLVCQIWLIEHGGFTFVLYSPYGTNQV